MEKTGKTPSDFQCHYCNKSCERRDQLVFHLRVHTSAGQFTCQFCNKTFTRQLYLKSHLKIHIGVKEFKCETCKKEFLRRAELKQHIRIHESHREMVECPVCSIQFARKDNLKQHIRRQHDQAYRNKLGCIFCKATYSHTREFETHIFSHIKERPYFCKVCGLECSTKSHRHRHFQTKHDPSRQKNFQCELCPSKFFSVNELHLHIQSHLQEKSLKCEICQKSFRTSSFLTKHRLVHSDEKGFKCRLCGNGFKAKSDLTRHIRQVHKQPCST